MGKGLFVTGTGTDIGKTYVTGLIVKALNKSGASAAYFKAAMSGNERRPDGSLIPGDAAFVKKMSGIGQPLEEMCPYVYETAVSPHLAAKFEGGPVELARVMDAYREALGRYALVTSEGSGGLLCPLRYDEKEKLFLPQVIRAMGCGCLLVADAGLGTINSVWLTAYYMERENIPLKGIIFNHYAPDDPLHEDNLKMCEALTGAKVLACVKDGDTELDMNANELMELYQ